MNRLKRVGTSRMVELYHGTSSAVLESIFENGIMPQGLTDNSMFNYNDYGRKGEAKHPQCVYLTDDIDNAMRYAANAVKHLNGFPIVLKVEVATEALTWDDDAFYKNYGDFDFGEKNPNTGVWVRRPKEEFWQQSLNINMQCAHFGEVPSSAIKDFYINSKWYDPQEFSNIYNIYKEMQLDGKIVAEDKKSKLKKLNITVNPNITLESAIVSRNIYLYSLDASQNFDNDFKVAFSIKLLEFIKANITEFGATIIYTPEFKRLNFNPKTSCFNYVFGTYKIDSDDKILEDIEEYTSGVLRDDDILDKIIDGTATQDEFDNIYEFSIDFVGDLVDYCKNVLGYDMYAIIDILGKIENNYVDSFDQLSAEIQYLKHKYKYRAGM